MSSASHSATPLTATTAVVVMGVAGCGKTTVGKLLADRRGVPFLDADAFHSAENVAKMRSGQPLTDDDRLPWLHALGDALAQYHATGVVLACSALRVLYRDTLRRRFDDLQNTNAKLQFVFLDVSRDVARRRVAARSGHFFAASDALIENQFATLEPLDPRVEGDAVVIEVGESTTVDQVVERVQKHLS